MILLVLQEHTPETVLDIFAEGAELTVAAVVRMETEVAAVTIGTVDALIRPLTLEAVREIAAIFVAIGLDTEETIFECERVMTAIAVLALGQMVPNAVLAAKLVQAEVWRLCAEHLHLILDRTTLLATLQIH